MNKSTLQRHMQREIVKTIQDQQDWKPHRAKLCINEQEHTHVRIAQNVTMSHHHSCMLTLSQKAWRQHAESDKRSKTSLNIQRLNDPSEHEPSYALRKQDTTTPALQSITFKLHSDSQTDVPKVIKTNGAMSIRIQFIQDGLQVMTVIAVSCVLHRSTNQVIHWLGLYTRKTKNKSHCANAACPANALISFKQNHIRHCCHGCLAAVAPERVRTLQT